MAGSPGHSAKAKESRLPRFLMSGGAATALHWLVMALLIGQDIQPSLATAVGASAGLIFNYLVQHAWTFRSGLLHRVAFPRYLTTSAFGWLLNLALFSVLMSLGAAIAIAQVSATALMTLVNFLLSERFVFHESRLR